MYPPNVVKQLIIKGANVRLGPGYTPQDLKEFTFLAFGKKVQLTIDCSGVSPVVANQIAAMGQSYVTLIC